MTLEYRDAMGGEVRSVDDDTRQVTARVCTFDGAPDTYRTTWAPGVFSESLRSAKPAVCWGHDQRNVVGSVIDYTEQPDGLDVTIQFADFDAVPQARAAYSLIKDGHVKGWSFGFAEGQTVPDPQHRGAMRFTRATLYEVSPVVRPSLPGTRTISVRSADGETREVSPETLASTLATSFTEALTSGERSVVVTVGDDGQVSVTGDTTATNVTSGEGSTADQADPVALAQSIDAVLDQAADHLNAADVSSWPTDAQQVAALVTAAGVAADELLDALGAPDPDDADDAGDGAEDTRADDALADEELLADLRAAAPDVSNGGSDHQDSNVAGGRSDDDLDVDLARAMATLAAQGVR